MPTGKIVKNVVERLPPNEWLCDNTVKGFGARRQNPSEKISECIVHIHDLRQRGLSEKDLAAAMTRTAAAIISRQCNGHWWSQRASIAFMDVWCVIGAVGAHFIDQKKLPPRGVRQSKIDNRGALFTGKDAIRFDHKSPWSRDDGCGYGYPYYGYGYGYPAYGYGYGYPAYGYASYGYGYPAYGYGYRGYYGGYRYGYHPVIRHAYVRHHWHY